MACSAGDTCNVSTSLHMFLVHKLVFYQFSYSDFVDEATADADAAAAAAAVAAAVQLSVTTFVAFVFAAAAAVVEVVVGAAVPLL